MTESLRTISQDEQHKMQDAEIRETLSHIENKILVMSGKGGVGKSTVAAYLAVLLAGRGLRVGLMDVDLHGPSIPRLLGLKGTVQPSFHDGKAMPVPFFPNLQVISIESLLGENKDVATIWRGPIKIGVIRQFISDMEWPPLDYLVIDSPPGTGDEPLTVAQTIPDAKALVVTTPQELSLADVRKSIHFCRQVNMKILGIVENMSGMLCPHCGKEIDLFGERGGELLARMEMLTFLGKLPLDPEVVRLGDTGNVSGLGSDRSPFTRAFNDMVQKVIDLTKENSRPSDLPDGKESKDATRTSEIDKIIFAVPLAEGKLCSHFGHCEQFALLETESGRIKGKVMHTPPPHEPGVLPKWLHDLGAQVIIAGGMGSKAQQLFSENGIKVITGAPMDPPEALVTQYLSGLLVTGANVCDH
ncbi:MAG: chromosome partitioning protein ParA [Desulfobacteraceae bacterium]|nr:MAG: chromosome partitioning protein ParA [Desulfobacteraceae bacterium]